MKLIRFLESWFEVGPTGQSECLFKAGEHYPVTDETRSHLARGIAEEVDAPPDAEKSAAAAQKAEDKAQEATEQAESARKSADAANAAMKVAAAADKQAADKAKP